MKCDFLVQVLPKFAKALTDSKYVSCMSCLSVIVLGKSNLLIGDLRRKRRKEEKFKELEISNYDLDIKNSELADTIHELKDKIAKYRDVQRESIKYKEIDNDLIYKGVLNEHGEEIIMF